MNRNRKGQFSSDSTIGVWIAIIILATLISITYIVGGEDTLVRGLLGFKNEIWINNALAAQPYSEMTIEDKIAFYAAMYHIDDHQFYQTLHCESKLQNIQSKVYREGRREPSYGIAQIDLDYHAAITKEQALDIDWSLEWAARHFKTETWYAYNRLTDKCN